MPNNNEELRRMDDERMAKLETQVTMWMETTTEYRKSLCAKIDTIMAQIAKLPCESRSIYSKGISTQLSWLWRIVFVVVLSLFAYGAAWGTLKQTVVTNTGIIKEHDISINNLEKITTNLHNQTTLKERPR